MILDPYFLFLEVAFRNKSTYTVITLINRLDLVSSNYIKERPILKAWNTIL